MSSGSCELMLLMLLMAALFALVICTDGKDVCPAFLLSRDRDAGLRLLRMPLPGVEIASGIAAACC